jgi:hypothetical protein
MTVPRSGLAMLTAMSCRACAPARRICSGRARRREQQLDVGAGQPSRLRANACALDTPKVSAAPVVSQRAISLASRTPRDSSLIDTAS